MHRLLSAVVVFFPVAAIASCGHAASPCGEFMKADVVAFVLLDDAWHPTRYQTISRGVILKPYKGVLDTGRSITFYGEGVCYDAPDAPGAIYLVYARRLKDGRYSTDCTRTRLMGDSTWYDIMFLDRFCSLPWLATILEPFACNEHRLPGWLWRIWIWSKSPTR